MKVNSKWLGRVSFESGLQWQQWAHQQVEESGEIMVLGCEHDAVITLGKRADENEDVLDAGELPVVRIDRGGHATLHSAGQLVIYPIVPIGLMNWKLREFVSDLQLVCRQALLTYNIKVSPSDGEPGLYSERGKLVFVGIRVRHGITGHGISINVNNDLELFRRIRSCGVSSESFDCICNYAPGTESKSVFTNWCEPFFKLVSGRVETVNHL